MAIAMALAMVMALVMVNSIKKGKKMAYINVFGSSGDMHCEGMVHENINDAYKEINNDPFSYKFTIEIDDDDNIKKIDLEDDSHSFGECPFGANLEEFIDGGEVYYE